MAEGTHVKFGPENRGFQVGIHKGSINNVYHAPPEQLETSPKPCLTIPFRRDTDFVDRETLLDQIHDICSRPASRAALVGLGGVGKSQLAIEYAYRTKDAATQKNQPTWVFWIHAETQARVEEDFRFIADTIKLPGRKQPDADIPKLVEQWLRSEENGPWLLILDSADNASVLFEAGRGPTHTSNATALNDTKGRAFWTYLPQSSHGSILITTRNKNVAWRLTDDSKSIIEVDPMETDHALALLERKAGDQPDMENGAALVEALERMPLAISQAGAYIRQQAPRASVGKYLEKFRKSERQRLSLLNRDEGDLRRDRNASNSVIVTWQISFESIRSDRPSAADLLSLMSFFDRQGISESLVKPPYHTLRQDGDANYPECGKSEECDVAGKSEECGIARKGEDDSQNDDSCASSTSENSTGQVFEDDLLMLRSYSLISTDDTGAVFEMHSLVQLATRRWLRTEKKDETFKEEFVSRLAREFTSAHYDSWAKCQKLFAHVEGAIQHRPKRGKPLGEWAQVLSTGGSYAEGRGWYSLAETMAKTSMDASMEALGKDHQKTWDNLAVVGQVHHKQGKYEEAEKLFVEVTETFKQKLGLAHPHTLSRMCDLGLTYFNQGRLEDAEKQFVEVTELYKQKFGPSHAFTLTSIGNLASTYNYQGRLEKAEKLFLEIIEPYKKEHGPDSPHTLTMISNLATVYQGQQRWEEAEKLEVEIMEIRERTIGLDHPDSLVTMNNLASTYEHLGRQKEAEKLFLEAVERGTKNLGRDNPITIASMINLASSYKHQRRWEEAGKLYSEAMQTSKGRLGPAHPQTLSSMAHLAQTLRLQGLSEEAEKLEAEVKVMEDLKKKPGPAHSDKQCSCHHANASE